MHEHHFILDGKINKEKVDDVIGFLEKRPCGTIRMGICSHGGDTMTAEFLLAILNEHKDRITLHGINNLFSAGFDIFLKFEGKKILSYGCVGMAHKARVEIDVNG